MATPDVRNRPFAATPSPLSLDGAPTPAPSAGPQPTAVPPARGDAFLSALPKAAGVQTRPELATNFGELPKASLWDVRETAMAPVASDPSALGLTQDDWAKAGNASASLQKALDAMTAGDTLQTLRALQEAAAAGIKDIAQKAILFVSQKLPDAGPLAGVRALLGDPTILPQLLAQADVGLSAIGKLSNGDIGGAIRDLAAIKPLRDAALDVLGRAKGVQDALDKLGFDLGDLKKAGDSAPEILDATLRVLANDFQGAMASLQKMPEALKDLVVKGVKTAAQKLPTTGIEGIARALLTDSGVVKRAISDPAVRDAFTQLLSGDVAGSLKALLLNDDRAASVLDALKNSSAVQDGLKKLGLDAGALGNLRNVAPELVQAAAAAASGDVKKAIASLAAAVDRAPDLVKQAVLTAAAQLGGTGLEGLAKSILADANAVDALVKSPQGRAVMEALTTGRIPDAFQLIANIATSDLAGALSVEALTKNPELKAALDKLGLTGTDLRLARPVLGQMISALQAVAQGRAMEGLAALKDAVATIPTLAKKMITGIAQGLGDTGAEGVVKTLLKDPAFLETITNKDSLRPILAQLSSGDVGGAIRTLAQNRALTGPVIDLLTNNKAVQDGLKLLGLTKDDLKRGNLPELINAVLSAGAGKIDDALKQLQDAVGNVNVPDLIQKAILALGANLPSDGFGGVVKSLLTDKDFVSTLTQNPDVRAALGLLAQGNLAEGLRALAGNEAVARAALAALAKNPDVKAGLDKLGVGLDALAQGRAALPEAMNAVLAIGRGDLAGAFGHLQAAAEKAPELVKTLLGAAARTLPDGGVTGILKSVLTDPSVLDQLVKNPTLRAVIARLGTGDLSALKDVVLNAPIQQAVADGLLALPEIQSGLAKLGLTADDVKGSFKGLLGVAQAARALVSGDFQAAFGQLKAAVADLPPGLMEKALMKGGALLPEQGPAGIVRSLLTDANFVHQILTNPQLGASFDQMLKGGFEKGLRDILGDDAFRDAAAGALAGNAELMGKLSKFGLKTAADLSAVGKGVVDLMRAGEAVAKGDLGEALSYLREALKDSPDDVKGRILDALTQAVHVPDWAKDAIVGLGSLIGNETVSRSFGDALTAFNHGDIGGFVSGLSKTAEAVVQTDGPLAVAFLDRLSNLPGTMGKLFKDHDLNAALVKSGSLGHVFDALGKAATGNLGGAVDELGKAASSLITAGSHFKLFGTELPFGEEGVKALGKVFERFVDCLPDKLKAKIAEATAKIGARNILNFIPFIGPVLNGVGDGRELVDDLQKNPRDDVKVAIDAAQLGVDVAGLVPGINAITTPLKLALGGIKVIKGAADLIDNLEDFKRLFTGMIPPMPQQQLAAA